MLNYPKISVIVPIYNREKALKRFIDSVLNSTYTYIELILIDDGSTDNSWKIIQSYQDERIKAVHKSNGGVSSARNAGINIATGDFIHFIDSDDFIVSNLYSMCVDKIYQYCPDILIFDYRWYIEKNRKAYDIETSKGVEKDVLLSRQYITSNLLPVLVNVDSRKEFFIQNFVWNKLYKKVL